MKTSRISRSRLSIALLVVVVAPAVGCKSATAWKMPGSSLFSWNREPDASLLASENELPEYPEPSGPAGKYEPNSVASLGAGTPGTATRTQQVAPGVSMPTYGSTAQTVGTPQAGLAAQANGYATGPYGVRPTTSTAVSQASTTTGLPSPYGGSYSSGSTAMTGTPNITLPTNVAASLGSAAPAAQNIGNTIAPPATSPTTNFSQASYPTYPSATAGSVSLPKLPNLAAPNSLGTPNLASPNTAAVNVGGPSGVAMPTATSNAGLPSSVGSAATGLPAPSAYKGATTLGGFSPGTTGRSTGYDFGSGQTNPVTPPQTTLPPNTASGTNPLLR